MERPPLLLRTLGALTLERQADSAAGTVIQRGGKPLALLAYLVVASGKPVRRALLADLLWGDESPDRARGSLRQALHALRLLTGEELFEGDRDEVVLRADLLASDHAHLSNAAVRGDVDAMLLWYRGPFCDQVTVRGASAFERWLDAERHRVQRLLVASAERGLAERSAAGEVRRAAELARAIHAADPSLDALAATCADALIADGAFDEARALLEGYSTRALMAGDDAPPDVSSRLSRLQLTTAISPTAAQEWVPASEAGHRFVAREQELSDLLRAKDAAREGRATRIVLVGPPGIGKTRVLDEFEARLRARGTRVARLRLLPAMRQIPGSAFAAYARALCDLPGAMGISEASAAVLVELLPELHERFPSAELRDVPAADLMRSRSLAMSDLVAAIAEDRLTVLLVDDDHNVDDQSRASLEESLGRRDLRLLEVRTSRLSSVETSATRLFVGAFSTSDVRALLESIARLPDESWADEVVRSLTARTGGVPQLLLLRLRALVTRGVLRREGECWQISDSEGLAALGADAIGVGELIASLSELSRRALQVLAHFRREMPEDTLLVVLARVAPGPRPADWRGALGILEVRGLAFTRDTTWAVAHEMISDAVLALETGAEAEHLQDAFVSHYGAQGLTVPMLEHLALLCGAHDLRRAAGTLVRVASKDRALRRTGIRGLTLSARVAHAAGRPEWEPELRNATGWLVRRSVRSLVALGSAAALASVAVIWFGWMLWPRLEIDSAPMAQGPEFVIQPRIRVVDGFGRTLTRYSGVVLARGVTRGVVGDTIVPIRDGRASFERLALLDPPPGYSDSSEALVDFRSTGLARSVRTQIVGAWSQQDDEFRPVRIVVNGMEIDSTLQVRIGGVDSLHVTLTFEYTTRSATANYVVGAAARWMPRESATVRLAGLPRPVRRAWRTSSFVLPAPPTPGSNFVVVLVGQEESVEHVFSGTNWTAGEPRWNDGNDVADLSLGEIRALRSTGHTTLHVLNRGYRGRLSVVVVGADVRSTKIRADDWIEQTPVLGFAFEVIRGVD